MPNTEEQIDEDIARALANSAANKKYTPLPFRNHADLISTFHPAIQNGEISLHDWQVEEAAFLAQDCFTREQPLHHILCACNGSGKDAYIIAPFAVFMASCRIRSRTIITSSSFTQLHGQTENYINFLAHRINEEMSAKVFVVKQMHIVCTLTGSEIKMFVTDDAGRAEGYHPFPDYPKGELSVIVNEGKTVADGIYSALDRCTYNRYITVSSPGKTAGRMFNDYKRSVQYPERFVPGRVYSRKVTAFECKHISRERIESERLVHGEHNPWFRSARLAEFTSLDEAVVITLEAIQKCINFPPQHISFGTAAGLDLSAGGDEQSFTKRDGNKVVAQESFKISDNVVPYCITLFEKHGFTPKTASTIFADHGGVGAAYAQAFREKGWELSWIQNQGRPINPGGMYANRGAEMYFNVENLIRNCMILWGIDDSKLMSQLSSRYYTQHKTNGRIVLEAKRDARAKGHGSPDRADSLVLAFTGITVPLMQDLILEHSGKRVERPKHKAMPTTSEIAKVQVNESLSEGQISKAFEVWDNKRKFGDRRAELTTYKKPTTLTTSQILAQMK